MMKNDIVLFIDNDKEIEVQVNPEQETVWLTQKQIGVLYDVKQATISEHINNILSSGELDETSIGFSDKSSGGRKPKIYNLDMILSIGYRVNSKKGIFFRKWANNVLKQYMLEGYAVNQKRLNALNKTIELQSKMLSSTLELDNKEVLKAVNHYTNALEMLDDYDHQSLNKPKGTDDIYKITYEDVKNIIHHLGFDTAVFGVEKEPGKVEGILAAVYQNVFGKEVYPSLEEKASNLLYFMVKDHPFADGCKRIAASVFLEFLARNDILYKDGYKRISDAALVAITLMIAESNPQEKELMVALVMNFLLQMMNKELYPNIFKRKSFHLFRNVGEEKIDENQLLNIQKAYESFTPLYPEIKTTIQIVEASKTTCKRGEEYCVLFYSEKKEGYLQNIGYLGEQLDLYLVSKNIGTLWFGIGKPDKITYDGLDYVIMIAINKIDDETKFRKDMFRSKRKNVEEIWQGEYIDKVTDIVRFTPSACNTQPWFVENKNKLNVYRYKKPGKKGIMPEDKVSFYNRIDIGIFMCFLELCLNKQDISFERELFIDDGSDAEKILNATYIIKNGFD